MTELIVNFSDGRECANLITALRALAGMHRVTVVKHRPRRTDRQNRMYWPAIVAPFGDFLREQGEQITDGEAHELLKAKFLRRDVVDRRTGEIIGQTVRSTTDLDTAEFARYVDGCVNWMADMFHIVINTGDLCLATTK